MNIKTIALTTGLGISAAGIAILTLNTPANARTVLAREDEVLLTNGPGNQKAALETIAADIMTGLNGNSMDTFELAVTIRRDCDSALTPVCNDVEVTNVNAKDYRTLTAVQYYNRKDAGGDISLIKQNGSDYDTLELYSKDSVTPAQRTALSAWLASVWSISYDTVRHVKCRRDKSFSPNRMYCKLVHFKTVTPDAAAQLELAKKIVE
jgi:hypothetical protein